MKKTITNYQDLLKNLCIPKHQILVEKIKLNRSTNIRLFFAQTFLRTWEHDNRLVPGIEIFDSNDTVPELELNFNKPFNYAKISEQRKRANISVVALSDFLVHIGFKNDGGTHMVSSFLSQTLKERVLLSIKGRPRIDRVDFKLTIGLEKGDYVQKRSIAFGSVDKFMSMGE